MHPLGPLWRSRPACGSDRWFAAALALACGGVLAVALWLRPDDRGWGTHEQLGLPSCAAVRLFGFPCPTCGMTTGFAHAVRGQWVRAFTAQPFALLLAVVTAALGLLAAQSAVRGRIWSLNWYRIPPNRVLIVGLLLFVAAWVFKVVGHLAQYP